MCTCLTICVFVDRQIYKCLTGCIFVSKHVQLRINRTTRDSIKRETSIKILQSCRNFVDEFTQTVLAHACWSILSTEALYADVKWTPAEVSDTIEPNLRAWDVVSQCESPCFVFKSTTVKSIVCQSYLFFFKSSLRVSINSLEVECDYSKVDHKSRFGGLYKRHEKPVKG